MYPGHFNVHTAHLSLHPALCNSLNVIRTLILHISGILLKFSLKNSKLSLLTENWSVRKLGGSDSKSRLSCLKFWPQKSIFWQICLKIGIHGIWRMLIFISTLVFWNFNPKSIFGEIWVRKVKVVHFDWKLAHRVFQGCWFLFCD